MNPTRRQLLVGSAAIIASARAASESSDAGPVATQQTVPPTITERDSPLSVALLVFPNLTQLDATGPFEVLTRIPGVSVTLVAASLDPVRTRGGLRLLPDADYSTNANFDILCVPGGGGVDPLITDAKTLDFIRKTARGATYVTGVCTGVLLLGAAGLLQGKKATTHWTTGHFLDDLGGTYIDERVVVDGNLITGAGVTSGIDFGFALAELIAGRDTAAKIMLSMEYDPQPPFAGGRPEKSAPQVVSAYRDAIKGSQARREGQVNLAMAELGIKR